MPHQQQQFPPRLQAELLRQQPVEEQDELRAQAEAIRAAREISVTGTSPLGLAPTPEGAPIPSGGPPAAQRAQGFVRGLGSNIAQAAMFLPQAAAQTFQLGRQVARRPGTAIQDIVAGSGAMLDPDTGLPALLKPHAEQFAKAGEAFGRRTIGGVAEGLGRGALGAIPLIGPFVAEQLEEVASGDPRRQGRGAGELLGTAAQMFAPAAVRRMPIPKAATVPLTFGERGGGPLRVFSRFLEGIFERTSAGAMTFRPLRAEQTKAVIKLADDLAGETILKAGDDLATNAANAHLAMMDTENVMRVQADAIYAEIASVTGNVNIPAQRYAQRARPLLDRIERQALLVDPEELSRAQRLLQQAIDAPETIGYEAIADARSSMLRISRTAQEPRAGAIASQLADELDSMMIEAAEATGLPGLPARIREANALVKERFEIFSDRFVKRLAESSPEQLPQIVARGNSKQAALALRAAGPGGAPILKRTYGQYLIDQVVTGEALEKAGGRISEQIGGIATAAKVVMETRGINGVALAKLIEKQNQKGIILSIYGPGGPADWEDLAASIVRLQGKAGGSFPSLAAGALQIRMALPLLSALGVFPGPGLAGLGVSAQMFGSVAGLSFLMTRHGSRRAVIQYLKALEAGKAPQVAFWGGRVAQHLQDAQDEIQPSGPSAGPQAIPGFGRDPAQPLRVDIGQ